jgi:hypothetical protein
VREAVAGQDRYLDSALALRREKTKETLMFAGGRWDRIERRFLDVDPELVAVIEIQESQVPFIVWYAEFEADFRDGYIRDISAALAAGDRRAGKTFGVYGCQLATLIDVPILPSNGLPLLGWTVSKTYGERDELDEIVKSYIPAAWYHHRLSPKQQFEFGVGSRLRNLSADDPDTLKQGRVDILLYNEVQKMAARAVVNGLYGTADQSGICLMTANRPSEKDTRGEWLFDLKDAIDDELRAQATEKKREPLGIKYFYLLSKDNTKIDQPARKRVARLAAIIDPTTAEADDSSGGEWKRPGDKACWEFDRHKHLAPPPQIGSMRDITQQVVSLHYAGTWEAVGGVDFQAHPHIPGAFIRVFGDPDRPTYCFVDEHVEPKATEQLFLEMMGDRLPQYTPANLIWIGDASSMWQGAQHDFEGGELTSFEVFEGAGWTIIPPQEPKGKTGRGRNPFVDERLALFNELLRQGRIRVDATRCPWLAECMREATTRRDTGRRRLVPNKYAHMIDAATYPIWRLEPRPDRFRVDPKDIRLVDVNRWR